MPPLFSRHGPLYDLAVKALDGNEVAGISWHLVILTILAAAVSAGGAWLFYRRPPNFRRYNPAEYEERHRGFRGGLIALALVGLIEPVRLLLQFEVLPFFYSHSIHEALTARGGSFHDGLFGTLLAVNASAIGIRLGLIPITALAFLHRRRSLRLLGITYIALLVLLPGINDLLLTQMFEQEHQIVYENFRSLTLTLQLALLLIPYLIFSRRVNATFSH
jgi:hypothetical protein